MSVQVEVTFLSHDLVYLRVTGSGGLGELKEPMAAIWSDARWKPGMRVIMDRRAAAIRPRSPDIDNHIKFLGPQLEKTGPQCVAVVVSSELDFGIARMFQLKSLQKLDLEYNVFRDLAEACTWLRVDPQELPTA